VTAVAQLLIFFFFSFARVCPSLAPFILFSSPFHLSPFFFLICWLAERHTRMINRFFSSLLSFLSASVLREGDWSSSI
jgi:hypothetical protein